MSINPPKYNRVSKNLNGFLVFMLSVALCSSNQMGGLDTD